MFRKTFTLSLEKFSLLRIVILLGVFSISHNLYGQSGITTINITNVSATSSSTTPTSASDAINDIVQEQTYTINHGQGNNAEVSSYVIGGTTYDNFLAPDTLAIKRTDGGRFINIWYTLITDPDGTSTLSLDPDEVEDADLIYRLKSVNAGYDNILVNNDDEGLGTIQAQTERIDIIWYDGIVTCEPDNAVFPVVERGGNDSIKVAAITSLDENGEPDGFSSLIEIEDSDWPGTGQTFNNFLIFRRQTVGQDPLPLANIGTFVGSQPAQTVQGVAVSFTELGITANQVVYGYSLFAFDVDAGIHDLTDITTFPTTTKASTSGIDLIAGVTAAVSSDNCLTPASGPGGYKAALATWLKANETADVTSSIDNSSVTDWQDHWIGDHDFTAGGFSTLVYKSTSSTINFNQTVDFSGGSTSLSTADNEDFNTATSYTNKGINVAFRTNASSVANRQVIYEQGDNNRGISIFIRSGEIFVSGWNQDGGSPWNTGTVSTVSDTVSTNREYIITLEFNGNVGGTGTITAYKNGRNIGSISSVGLLLDHTGGGIELGGSDGNSEYDDGENASGNPFEGEISEFIYCNEPTNFLLAQRNRIESYLAIKYGITLNQDSPNNYVNSSGTTIFDATNNASIGGYLEYNEDITGIGRDDGSEFVQLKSKSENNNSIVTIERPTVFTSNNNFLLWGNDGGLRDDSETTDKPSVIARRIKKVWRAAETGESGNNNITFDLDQFTVTGSPGASDYSLLIAGNSSNGAFTGATIVTGGVIDGNNDITFSGVNLENGQYFTLGTAYASCGPGGIGTGSTLNLWLKADLGPSTSTNGADVSTWEDRAFSNDASATGVGSESPPSFVQNSINFNPSLDFDQSNSETLEGTTGFYSNAYYLVLAPDANTNYTSAWDPVLSFDISTAVTNRFGAFFLGDVLVGNPPNEAFGHIEGYFGSPHISYSNDNTSNLLGASVPTYFEVMENDGTTPTAYTLSRNGSGATVTSSGGFLDAENQEYSIASAENQGDFGDGPYFDGKVAEVISFNTTLTAAESNRVESYLSIKYAITRDNGSQDYVNSSGSTIWNATDNSTHNDDIAGIGRDDDSCLEQKQSKSVNSDAIVTIGLEDIAATNAANTNTFSADESFLVWGNDDALTTYAGRTTGVTGIGTVTERMTRIWRADETGTVGNTEISFDLSGLGYTAVSSNASDYQLIISSASNLLTSPQTYNNGTFNGDVITFDGIDFADGDYFTLGIARTSCSPGGVDTSLSLWLKANEGTGSSVNGAEIDTWADQSSSANNGAEDDIDSETPVNPTFDSSDINFNPSVTISSPGGNNGGFISTTSNSVSGNMSMIAVFKTGQIGGSTTDFEEAPTILGAGDKDDNADYGLGIAEGHVHINAANNTSLNVRSTSTYNDLEPYVLTGTREQANTAGSIQLYVNSGNVGNGTSTNTALSSPGKFGIGNLGAGGLAPVADAQQEAQFNGQIAEAIVYSQVLSAADRQKVESYLAIKYGITRNEGGSNTNYLASDGGTIWNQALTAYNSDIAGIGRDDGSCLTQTKSKSENDDALVTMEIGSFADDDSWLIWGNDNAALEDRSNTEFPPTINSRLNREWFVQETGTVGTITLTFNLSSINGPTGIGTNNLNQVRLLLDDNGLGTPNGDFTDNVNIISPTTIDSENDIITFDVNLDNAEYFTLGSLEKYALPIELVDFSAEEVQGDVLLTWITASEENNAFYTIERSLDGLNYEALANMDGAGTFTGIQNYEYWDNKPQKGFNFYRIKQTDIDGTSSYSPVESVLIDEDSEMSLLVSPNPISLGESVNVSWNLSPTSEIHSLYVLDIHGRVVFEQTVTNGQSRQEVPTRNFRKGLYLVRIRTKDYKSLTQKLIVE